MDEILKKTCADCYWHDQCAEEDICKHYDPIDPDELALEEYEERLEKRVEDYQELLEEAGEINIENLIVKDEDSQENYYEPEVAIESL